MSYGEQYGRLTEKTHRQKWVDEWTFYSPIKDAEPYKVRIRLVNKYSKGLFFRAICDHLRPPLEDSDINKLHKRVGEALRRQDISKSHIEWADWLEVEILGDPTSWQDESNVGIVITVRELKRGLHPETGNAYTINTNSVAVPFPRPKAAGEKDKNWDNEEWFREREEDHQFSYIPATPANRAALKALAERIQDLHGRLCTLLVQPHIQAALLREHTLRLESK